MEQRKQKRLAVINDLSGYGRCALTVAIPVISVMKVECCPVPTSILSNHMGFSEFTFDDFTQQMGPYLNTWEKLGVGFDGILTGFLGSKDQIDLIAGMIEDCKKQGTFIMVDPIMGDHGVVYKTFTQAMIKKMKELICLAHLITPNVTEACLLTDTPYQTKWKKKDFLKIASKLEKMGPEYVVITGIEQGGFVSNLVWRKGKEPVFVSMKKLGEPRHGTGDLFAAVLAAHVVRGGEITEGVKKAASFVKLCVKKSEELQIPLKNGVCFEEVLYLLGK